MYFVIYLIDRMREEILMSPRRQLGTESLTRIARFAGVPLRLMIGYGFLMHGLAKWHRGPEVFAAVLHSLGMPFSQILAWTTTLFEIVGGITFLLGAGISVVSISGSCRSCCSHSDRSSSLWFQFYQATERQRGKAAIRTARLRGCVALYRVRRGTGAYRTWSVVDRRIARTGPLGKRGHFSDSIGKRAFAHQ